MENVQNKKSSGNFASMSCNDQQFVAQGLYDLKRRIFLIDEANSIRVIPHLIQKIDALEVRLTTDSVLKDSLLVLRSKLKSAWMALDKRNATYHSMVIEEIFAKMRAIIYNLVSYFVRGQRHPYALAWSQGKRYCVVNRMRMQYLEPLIANQT